MDCELRNSGLSVVLELRNSQHVVFVKNGVFVQWLAHAFARGQKPHDHGPSDEHGDALDHGASRRPSP